MQKYITFYKENNLWYADVPNHTKEENLMIGGSDKLLDAMLGFLHSVIRGCDDYNKILIHCTDKSCSGTYGYELKLEMYSHNQYGANYTIVDGKLADRMELHEDECYLCNVVHDIFGEHPKLIYIIDIKLCP